MQAVCLAGALGLLLMSVTGQAQAEEQLDLPDLVILREGVPLPVGLHEREVRGLVVEMTEEVVRVDVSTRRGIRQVISLPRADVEKVERGDASLRFMGMHPDWFVLPPFSRPPAFYTERRAGLEDFLRQHPQARNRDQVESLLEELKREQLRVEQGQIRVGDAWHEASGLAGVDREAWSFLTGMAETDHKNFIRQSADFAQQVQASRRSRFFPQILLYYQERAERYRPEVARSSPVAARLLEEQSGRYERLLVSAGEAFELIRSEGVAERDRGVNLLVQAAAAWPELEEIGRFLESQRAKQMELGEDALRSGRWDEAESRLERFAQLAGVLGAPDSEAAGWMELARKRSQAGRAADGMLMDWKARRLEGLKERMDELLAAHEAHLLESAREDLKRASADLVRLRQEEERQTLLQMLESGKWEQLAREIEAGRLRLQQATGERATERTWLAETAVEAAWAAVCAGRPGLAVGLVMDAWRIDSGNIRAQVALTVLSLTLLVGGGVVAAAVVLGLRRVFQPGGALFFQASA